MTVTIHLAIDRAVIGDEFARDVFVACRWAAQRIDPQCAFAARYEYHERIGWAFAMSDRDAARHLLLCWEAALARKPLKHLLP